VRPSATGSFAELNLGNTTYVNGTEMNRILIFVLLEPVIGAGKDGYS
jgi:hypothetical protein